MNRDRKFFEDITCVFWCYSANPNFRGGQYQFLGNICTHFHLLTHPPPLNENFYVFHLPYFITTSSSPPHPLFIQSYFLLVSHILFSRCKIFTNRPWDPINLVLKSTEKVKPGFLLSLMCLFPESNGTKFWSHSFHLQNSDISQTRMDQKEDPTETNFDIFQIQKWIS